MRIRAALAVFALLVLIPASALASLANEQRQGGALAARVSAGAKSCTTLTADDLDLIGEYAMFRALGSTSVHRALNDRMTIMLGADGETRMHQLLGRRYAGCSRAGTQDGYGMMGGHVGAGWGSMMGPAGRGGWGWMMSGSWRTMNRYDWRQLERRVLGAPAGAGGGWSPAAIVAVTVASVVLLSVLGVAVLRPPWRHERPPTRA